MRSIVRRNFNIVDEDIGKVDSRWQFGGKTHVAIHDEFEMVGAWLQVNTRRERVLMFARPTVIGMLALNILHRAEFEWS